MTDTDFERLKELHAQCKGTEPGWPEQREFYRAAHAALGPDGCVTRELERLREELSEAEHFSGYEVNAELLARALKAEAERDARQNDLAEQSANLNDLSGAAELVLGDWTNAKTRDRLRAVLNRTKAPTMTKLERLCELRSEAGRKTEYLDDAGEKITPEQMAFLKAAYEAMGTDGCVAHELEAAHEQGVASVRSRFDVVAEANGKLIAERDALRSKLASPPVPESEWEHARIVAKNYADAGDIPHESRGAMEGCIIAQRSTALAQGYEKAHRELGKELDERRIEFLAERESMQAVQRELKKAWDAASDQRLQLHTELTELQSRYKALEAAVRGAAETIKVDRD
jgi:hypothetical protein